MPELLASLAVLAFGCFHRVAEDDRRQQGDGSQHQGGDDEGDERVRVARGEADEEGDDRQEKAEITDPLAQPAEAVELGASDAYGVVHHAGSQSRAARSSRSCAFSRSREKWRRATSW